jgi:hypothetical protein
LKPGTSSVFVGEEGGVRSPFSLKLDVREEARRERHLFGAGGRSVPGRARPKLFHYISAGGMRQLRRTSVDDLVEDRRRSFLVALGWVAVAWLVFYFMPSA